MASHNLSLAKLYEGHTDALAILAELQDQTDADDGQEDEAPVVERQKSWGVWAAETSASRVVMTPLGGNLVQLNGTKSWCSGAHSVSHGLMTVWSPDSKDVNLVRVVMNQPGVHVSSATWAAIGMADSVSADVTLSNAIGRMVGKPGSYLSRPGFWHGGAGIAACWYGGAVSLGMALHRSLTPLPHEKRGAYRLAALGRVDVALHQTAEALRGAAQWIDQNPLGDSRRAAMRVRLSAENAAITVLDEAGRALGAGAFCRDWHFARAAADLPVFVRQSHAEHDFSALAECVMQSGPALWAL